MREKVKSIRGIGKFYIYRTEQFRLKQVVSDFIERLIELSAKNAANQINIANYATFCYGELQIHSILVPALAKLTNCFILEYPIRRGEFGSSGRVDYYCINRPGSNDRYNLFIEVKCGRQGIPLKNDFRRGNLKLWDEANKQLEDIEQEIRIEKDYYGNKNIRICMEIIILYSHSSKREVIEERKQEILQDAFRCSVNALGRTEKAPNISILWEFNTKVVNNAIDDYHGDKRKFWGLMFLCRIMPNTLSE